MTPNQSNSIINNQERRNIMSCEYYEFQSNLFSGDYWCKKKNCRVSDDNYYRYCRDYNYSECSIYKAKESSVCFITTIACQILGINDDNPLLNNLRNFRNNILQKNLTYYNILKEYDTIGPLIADCIINDKDKETLAQNIYQKALIPINNLILNNEYDTAIEKYYILTLLLINYYGLKHEYNHTKDNNYNYENFNPSLAGHGRVKRI